MMRTAGIFLGIVVLTTAIIPAGAQTVQDVVGQAEDFSVDLARPPESELASLADLRHRLPGVLLGGWIVENEAGPITLYVVAREYDSEITVNDASSEIADMLLRAGLRPDMNPSFTALGLPAFALSVEGDGSGNALNRVGGAPDGGTQPTYMRVVGVPIARHGQETPHALLMFTAVSPLEAREAAQAMTAGLVAGSRYIDPESPDSDAATQPSSPVTPASQPSGGPAAGTSPAPETPTTPAGFYLDLKMPDGWDRANSDQLPARIDGQFLAGWKTSTDHGPAAIHVLGRRAAGKFMIGQLGEVMQNTFTEAGLEADLESNVSVLGRPAFMLSVWGQGTGRSLNILSDSDNTGNLPTFLRVITLINPWRGEVAGVDFVKFVAIGPLKAVNSCLDALGDVVENSRITGSYSPPQPEPPAPEPAAAPAPAEPATAEVSELGTAVFGSIYTLNNGSVTMRSLRILRAVKDGGIDLWTAPKETAPDDLLLLVSSTGMKAWALSGKDAREIGDTVDSGIQLKDDDRLIPYRANWRELLR